MLLWLAAGVCSILSCFDIATSLWGVGIFSVSCELALADPMHMHARFSIDAVLLVRVRWRGYDEQERPRPSNVSCARLGHMGPDQVRQHEGTTGRSAMGKRHARATASSCRLIRVAYHPMPSGICCLEMGCIMGLDPCSGGKVGRL